MNEVNNQFNTNKNEKDMKVNMNEGNIQFSNTWLLATDLAHVTCQFQSYRCIDALAVNHV